MIQKSPIATVRPRKMAVANKPPGRARGSIAFTTPGIAGLRGEWYGSRSGERLTEPGEDHASLRYKAGAGASIGPPLS